VDPTAPPTPSRRETETSGRGARGATKQTLLVVEDSLTHRRNLRDVLDPYYELLWAANARDALAIAFTRRPHLILLDVNIEPPPITEFDKKGNPRPGREVGGLEVCRQLKKSILQYTPVLILSAQRGFLTRIKGRMAHANDYLTKPVEDRVLLETIFKHLGSPRGDGGRGSDR